MARREIIVPKNDKLNVSRNLNLPHSPGIRAGDFIFLSGMLSTDPQTGERSPGTMAHETRQTLTNMRHLLESAGSSLERVVKINVLIYDMSSKNGGRRMNVLLSFHAKVVPRAVASAFHCGEPSPMSA